MKQILVISGSPRPRGNTYRVTNLIEQQLQKLGEVEFEYFFLKKANLDYCHGCLICMKKGEENCPCKDDALLLRDKMLAADGVAFISPVYVHTVSAMMKNFYDRFSYMCHQPHFLDKAAILVVTTELSGADETLEYMTLSPFSWGFRMAGSLDVVYRSFKHEGQYREETEKRIEELARDFYHALTTPRHKPLFRELMFFNIMKSKVTLHRNILPHDYEYWKEKGWLDCNFYHEDDLPKLKSRLARILAGRRARRIIDKYGLSYLMDEQADDSSHNGNQFQQDIR